jgi:hypothetical protein
MAAPVVTSVTPNHGQQAGGQVVTITGTGFTGATSVRIGGQAATAVTVVNDTTITATSPAHAEGPASIAVTTPSGTGSSAGPIFTYLAPLPVFGTVIPGEPREKTAGTNPYTLVLPTFAFMPLVLGVKFNLSAVPPWEKVGSSVPGTTGPAPPPPLTMTRTPAFPAYPS